MNDKPQKNILKYIITILIKKVSLKKLDEESYIKCVP